MHWLAPRQYDLTSFGNCTSSTKLCRTIFNNVLFYKSEHVLKCSHINFGGPQFLFQIGNLVALLAKPLFNRRSFTHAIDSVMGCLYMYVMG